MRKALREWLAAGLLAVVIGLRLYELQIKEALARFDNRSNP